MSGFPLVFLRIYKDENADLETVITDYPFSQESDEDFTDIDPVILIQWDISGE